jgi:hypothetical protein
MERMTYHEIKLMFQTTNQNRKRNKHNNNRTTPSPVTADLPMFGDFSTSQTIYIFWKSRPRKKSSGFKIGTIFFELEPKSRTWPAYLAPETLSQSRNQREQYCCSISEACWKPWPNKTCWNRRSQSFQYVSIPMWAMFTPSDCPPW